jgi:hypothetical protein
LIARLIGEELARSNCGVGKVEELINNARGKAEAFIILHINGLFKVDEDPDTAEALVEIFALRGTFIDEVKPGDPILTPSIVELISEVRGAKILYGAEGGELRGWLAIRQHDLIEEAIEELLDCIVGENEECKDLGDALKPWVPKTVKLLKEVSEKVLVKDDAVKYFVHNYGKEFTNALRDFSNKCWRRAALIIGHALAGRVSVHRPEDLPSDVAEPLGDALRGCDIDNYLLVGNKIPRLIWYLIENRARALAKVFIDRYNEAVGEVRRILNIARDRGSIYDAEKFYGLGLASIIASTAKPGKVVKPGDANAALHIASFAIQHVASPDLIKPILSALKPLRGKAPQRYIELLAHASNMENLDSVTVLDILIELNGFLIDYGDVIKGRAWSLVNAISAYANLLMYFSDKEIKNTIENIVGGLSNKTIEDIKDTIENIVDGAADLLNELDKLSPSLGVVAWAYALAPALEHGIVRRLMEEKLGINVVGKASEVLEELSKLRGLVQDLMRDEEFMSYIESMYIKADEEAVKKEILEASSHLKHALAQYRLDNDELDEAAKLFNETAEEIKEIAYENYLVARGLALRVEAIKGSLVGDGLTKLVDGFRQLYEETFNKKPFMRTARHLIIVSAILSGYLVSLALTGDHETINKLLEEHLWVLNADRRASVLTRLMLNALLSPRGRLSSELKGKLSVNPEELIDAFESDIDSKYLPALRVAFKMISPEVGIKLCEEFNDEVCIDFVLAVKGNSTVVKQLREGVINAFNNSLKGFGFDAESLINEFKGLVYGLDGKSLVQLIAPTSSMAQLALMLHALVNGDGKLAKAHTLIGTVRATGSKLLTRLFLEAYKACCDLGKDEFRLAIAKLFLYHV